MNNGNYVDFYEDLQVGANADQETIERVYRLLAKRYHPDNLVTGNIEKFNVITSAYKVLSDPEKRAAYDVKYDDIKNEKLKTLIQQTSSEGFEDDQQIRRLILSTLYIDKRQNPSSAGVGSWRLEQLLRWPEKILDFHIWYLKEKGWIKRTDTGEYEITVIGVEVVEKDGLILGKDRLLTDSSGLSENGDELERNQHSKIDLFKVVESNPENTIQ